MTIMLNLDDLNSILLGAAVLGSGGGGSLAVGQEILEEIKSSFPNFKVVLLEADELTKGRMAVSSAGIGSPTAGAGDTPFPYSPQRSLEALETALEADGNTATVSYLVPGETGPWATMITMLLAARKELAVVNADGGGRALPQLDMTYFTAKDVLASPMCIANDAPEGSKEVLSSVSRVHDTNVADLLVRGELGSSAFEPQTGAFSTWPVESDKVADVAITGTLEIARKIGKILVHEEGQGIGSIVRYLKKARGFACLLFTGKLIQTTEQTVDTFDLGTVTLSDGKRTLIVYNKNENMYAFFTDDPTPAVIGPDSICMIREDGTPLTNADLTEQNYGETFHILGVACDGRMRNPETVEIFRQAMIQIGYGGPYVPIETLQGDSTDKE